MGSDEAGRLLIYTYADSWLERFGPSSETREDLIELSATIQRRFPDQIVEPANLEWLRQAVKGPLPLPPKRDEETHYLRIPEAAEFLEAREYVYLVLGWLGATVSKHLADQAVKAAADLVREWMRARRNKGERARQIAYILGPDGKVLKKVQVQSKPPAERRAPRKRR